MQLMYIIVNINAIYRTVKIIFRFIASFHLQTCYQHLLQSYHNKTVHFNHWCKPIYCIRDWLPKQSVIYDFPRKRSLW